MKPRFEEENIGFESARPHIVMFMHVIAPKQRRSLKKSEQDECLFLDEGGLLTSDEIQEKIAAREAKRAADKVAKAEAQEKRVQAKILREQRNKKLKQNGNSANKLLKQKLRPSVSNSKFLSPL